MVGPTGRAVLGAAFTGLGGFQSLIAMMLGPGNSDEAISGGVLLIPWFGLPLGAICAALAAIVVRRRARTASRLLWSAVACLVLWFALSAVVV